MQVFFAKPDPVIREWLEERRALGLDHRDELWDGVLHVAPQPAFSHQELGAEFIAVLRSSARARGLRIAYEVSVFAAHRGEQNYRVPDLVVAASDAISTRGVEARAALVLEILSPDDESRAKLPFYAACGIPEVWLVEPTTRVAEVLVLAGDAYVTQAPDADGWIAAPALGLALRTTAAADGPRLAIRAEDVTTEV